MIIQVNMISHPYTLSRGHVGNIEAISNVGVGNTAAPHQVFYYYRHQERQSDGK